MVSGRAGDEHPGARLPLTTPPLSPTEMLSMGSGALKQSRVRPAVFHADGQVKYASHASDVEPSFLFSYFNLVLFRPFLLSLSLFCHPFSECSSLSGVHFKCLLKALRMMAHCCLLKVNALDDCKLFGWFEREKKEVLNLEIR